MEVSGNQIHGVGVCSTEAVDRLSWITDRNQSRSGFHDLLQNSALDGVGVLGFIDKNNVKLRQDQIIKDSQVEHVVEVNIRRSI